MVSTEAIRSSLQASLGKLLAHHRDAILNLLSLVMNPIIILNRGVYRMVDRECNVRNKLRAERGADNYTGSQGEYAKISWYR